MTDRPDGNSNGFSLSALGAALQVRGRFAALLIAVLVVWGLPWVLVLLSISQGFRTLADITRSGDAAIHQGRIDVVKGLSQEHAAIIAGHLEQLVAIRALADQLALANCLQIPPDIRRRLMHCAALTQGGSP